MNTVFAAKSVKDLLAGDSSLSAYFASQFESLTPWNVLVALGLAMVMGLLIAFVYRRCYRGVLYSPSFAMTLVMLVVITTPVVMCIKSDIALSMGMVGALSIVRFRTAIKDPMDTAYMFWSLTMGILLGAGLHVIALSVALGIALIIFLMSAVKLRTREAYLLVVHYNNDTTSPAEKAIEKLLHTKAKQRRLRSKTVTRSSSEITYEVRLKETDNIITGILAIEGVFDATLVACQTEAGL